MSRPTTSLISIFLPSLDGGGAEKIMLLLAKKFVERGYRCQIVIAITKGKLLDAVPSGVGLVKLGERKTILSSLKLARYLRREKPSALLATVFTANLTALLANLLAGNQTRTVIVEASPTDHDVVASSGFRTWINVRAAKALYRHAAASIAISEGVRKVLLDMRLIDEKRIHVIYNPVPLPPLAQNRRLIGVPTILACGRLEPQKDYETLLRVFARVRSKIHARLLILGEGSLESSLKRQAAELGITDAVRFAGFVADPGLHMNEAAVFVHTARYEGFGVVLLEALARRCPIIATDCPGGIRTVLDNGTFGALVPLDDDEALSQAIVSVLNGSLTFPDPKKHLEKFDPDVIADHYLSVLFPNDH
jgi:glycosyltransferase involved in cell wall biosynthesis